MKNLNNYLKAAFFSASVLVLLMFSQMYFIYGTYGVAGDSKLSEDQVDAKLDSAANNLYNVRILMLITGVIFTVLLLIGLYKYSKKNKE